MPVRHVAPAFGNAHIVWKQNKITLDGYINYNARLSHGEISHELSKHLFVKDADGNPYAPSWLTFNVEHATNSVIQFHLSELLKILPTGLSPLHLG